MLKCIKRRRVDEEEDSENESKLLNPSTSKEEKYITDKTIAFKRTVNWPWVTHGLETIIARFRCSLFAEKISNTAMVPAN
jgi:hypothetical protein